LLLCHAACSFSPCSLFAARFFFHAAFAVASAFRRAASACLPAHYFLRYAYLMLLLMFADAFRLLLLCAPLAARLFDAA